MAVRTHVLWAVLVISAAATWIFVFRPGNRLSRFVIGFVSGFNCIWIVSFVGLPVVAASLVAVSVAAVPSSRRWIPVLLALAVFGLGLGLVMLRLTEPPGEHIFG